VEQPLRFLVRCAGGGDSEARLGTQHGGPPAALEPLDQPGRHLLGAGATRPRQQDRELVAADPERLVVGPELSAKEPADSDEAIVSGGVTVPVVQLLETVEVEHDQRERSIGGDRLRYAALELTHERAPVRQLCQRVVVGEVAHLLELRRERQGARRLVGEDPQGLQPFLAGEKTVLGLVDPDDTDDFLLRPV
jgi:hypothetical protein